MTINESLNLIKTPNTNLGPLTEFPVGGHSIVYNTNRASIGKVDFVVNGQLIRRERYPPYALAGDTKNGIIPYNKPIFKVEARVYDKNGKLITTLFKQLKSPKFSQGMLLLMSRNGRFISILKSTDQLSNSNSIIYNPANLESVSLIQKVRFFVNGKYHRTETRLPYSLESDNGFKDITPYNGRIDSLRVDVIGEGNAILQRIDIKSDGMVICFTESTNKSGEQRIDTDRGKLFCVKSVESFAHEQQSSGIQSMAAILIIILSILVYRKFISKYK